MQGEKVVSRSRGFTVDTCVSGKAAAEESPIFNGLSTGAKVWECGAVGGVGVCGCLDSDNAALKPEQQVWKGMRGAGMCG
jgi:hypothetical protein